MTTTHAPASRTANTGTTTRAIQTIMIHPVTARMPAAATSTPWNASSVATTAAATTTVAEMKAIVGPAAVMAAHWSGRPRRWQRSCTS
ncbi:MAG TPA: hypothetical protein DC048_02595 [Planctomycetaceae bacterium]|nr:hypothetical protein [Planctomycetaceae bacterium]